MSKICCIEDSDISPKSSSCSMILRSACSHHKHSRESSTVKEDLRTQKFHKKQRKSTSHINEDDVCNGTLRFGAVLESSLKQLALKSAKKTYSLLKERFYSSYELSEDINQAIFEAGAINVSCAKELNFSHLSALNRSAFDSIINHKECNSDYSSASESDISESLESTSKMSVGRLTRSSIAGVKPVSGFEGEDDISVRRIMKTRNNNANVNANFGTPRNSVFSELESTSQHVSNNHVSFNENHSEANSHSSRYTGSSESGDSGLNSTESSHLDRSTVQSSAFDRFRWFLWRYTYLMIIKCVNFDAWFLSMLQKTGKHKIIFWILAPLLLYILWGYMGFKHSSVLEVLSQALQSVISPIFMFFSSIFSSIYSYFILKEELISNIEKNEDICISDSSKVLSFFSSLYAGLGLFSGWFSKAAETVPYANEAKHQPERFIVNSMESDEEEVGSYQPDPTYQPSNAKVDSYQPSREEIILLAREVLKDEISLLKIFQRSESQAAESDKLMKEHKIQSEIQNLRLEFQSLSGTMQRLEKNVAEQNEKSETAGHIALTNEYKMNIENLDLKLKTIEAKLGILEGLKGCCDKQWSQGDLIALLEDNLIVAFKNVIAGDSNSNSRYQFFRKWLNSEFFNREKLMQEINIALRQQSAYQENAMNHDYVAKVVESTVLKYVDSIKKNLTNMDSYRYFDLDKELFSEDKIRKIVKEAIMLYDADKTGQVDYALESGGGSVLGTRCSETYVEKYGKLSIFGVPLWTDSNSPRTAIQPDVQPGRCWAFKGTQGFLVIELSATIYPTGFTMEHIPVSLSPTGSIDSAPKNFSVWGLESEKDSRGNLLGEYWYDISGEPLQYFAIQKTSEKPYSYVELQIHSNHGNIEYTCLYRFRVHGQRIG